jgi:hypothetical protein
MAVTRRSRRAAPKVGEGRHTAIVARILPNENAVTKKCESRFRNEAGRLSTAVHATISDGTATTGRPVGGADDPGVAGEIQRVSTVTTVMPSRGRTFTPQQSPRDRSARQ